MQLNNKVFALFGLLAVAVVAAPVALPDSNCCKWREADEHVCLLWAADCSKPAYHESKDSDHMGWLNKNGDPRKEPEAVKVEDHDIWDRRDDKPSFIEPRDDDNNSSIKTKDDSDSETDSESDSDNGTDFMGDDSESESDSDVDPNPTEDGPDSDSDDEENRDGDNGNHDSLEETDDHRPSVQSRTIENESSVEPRDDSDSDSDDEARDGYDDGDIHDPLNGLESHWTNSPKWYNPFGFGSDDEDGDNQNMKGNDDHRSSVQSRTIENESSVEPRDDSDSDSDDEEDRNDNPYDDSHDPLNGLYKHWTNPPKWYNPFGFGSDD